MLAPSSRNEIKTVGRSGQISLGKSYAGRVLQVRRQEDGAILLTPVVMVPEDQMWTLAEPHRTAIEQGMNWAARNAPAETDLATLSARGRKPAKASRNDGTR